MDVRNIIPIVFPSVFIHFIWNLVLSWLHWHKRVQSVKKKMRGHLSYGARHQDFGAPKSSWLSEDLNMISPLWIYDFPAVFF